MQAFQDKEIKAWFVCFLCLGCILFLIVACAKETSSNHRTTNSYLYFKTGMIGYIQNYYFQLLFSEFCGL